MVTISWVTATILLASMPASRCTGPYGPKKIQILVPHNIHHHTHTKYTFIPIPVTRVANKTEPNAAVTPRPPTLVPVMPVLPLVPANITPPTAPLLPQAPPPPFQPSPPAQPAFLQPLPTQPPAFLQPLPTQPPAPPNSRYIHHHNHDHHDDFDYNDLAGRGSRNKIIRADPPQPAPVPPIKFKTIINVHETKKIPLPNFSDFTQFINEQSKKKLQFPKLLDFPKLFKADPPKRIKVEVYPEKNQQIKQMEKILAQWRDLQESLKSNPFPGLKAKDLEFDSETAAYKYPPETVVEKPEWAALKQLLEKQIESDFPGLKVDAEIKPISYNERALQDESDGKLPDEQPDLRHIGYIVIGDNNEKHFVGVDGSVTTSKT